MNKIASLVVVLALVCASPNARTESSTNRRTPESDRGRNQSFGSFGAREGESRGFSDKQRLELYEQMKLDWERAVGYSLLFPGLGNLYTEQYVLAGLSFSLMAFSAVFVSYGFATSQSSFVWGGGGLAAGVYGGAALTTLGGVERYNRQLSRALSVEPSTAREEITKSRGVAVRISF